jgi:predicted ATPase
MPDGPTLFRVESPPDFPLAEAWSAYLEATGWNDWFKFETLYRLWIVDSAEVQHEIGLVKIGRTGMSGSREPASTERYPLLLDSFDKLSEEYFSVGQDESYYVKLNAFDGTLRDGVLIALRDVAFNVKLFEERLNEPVMENSLLRSVSAATVKGQFHRLASGGARLTPFNYEHRLRRYAGSSGPPPALTFAVEPGSMPPTNIHVIIGRNGSGKTDMLTHMARSLVESGENTSPFSCVVSVSFSAFDAFELLSERRGPTEIPRLAYVGIRRTSNRGDRVGSPKSPEMLANEFVASMRICREGAREPRWRQALATLEQDPIFHEAEISTWGSDEAPAVETATKSRFNRLSSGHKIVLLTITRLVELIEEKTLVLIYEPESHLHPPLLSAFIRSLSELLIARNGMSIIATHSPVVLQEAPKECVWMLRRYGAECVAERPTIETFGENVGILTREAFGLDVSKTGFHQMLADAVEEGGTYEEVLEHFNNKLGAEARAILRALCAQRTEDL